MDGICFCHEFTVAKINDLKGIIRMDFLELHNAIMRISKGLLHLAGTQIQLERKSKSVCTRVKIVKRAKFLLIMKSLYQGILMDVHRDLHLILLNLMHLNKMGKKGLVARTFVDPVKIKFSIVNVSNRHIRVDKNTTVASLQPVGIVNSKSDFLCKVSLELPEHIQFLI